MRTANHREFASLLHDHVNRSDSEGNVYQYDAGRFGEGFVWYLGGNMSRTEAN